MHWPPWPVTGITLHFYFTRIFKDDMEYTHYKIKNI
jgi:hypothetical protein